MPSNEKKEFIQDDWTRSFCETFSVLRKDRIIPTNVIFAKQVGLEVTGLAHILGGRRNFPSDNRLLAEELLNGYLSAQKVFEVNAKMVPEKEGTPEMGHPEKIEITSLKYKCNKLLEEIAALEDEKLRLNLQIDSLKTRLIQLQTRLMEELQREIKNNTQDDSPAEPA